MKSVVSSCCCTPDLRVNNLAQGARTVVHQKSRCFQSEEGGHMVSWICIFIWWSTHLLTRHAIPPSLHQPVHVFSYEASVRTADVDLEAKFLRWTITMEKPQRKPNPRHEGTKPRKVSFFTALVTSQLFYSELSYKYAAQYSAPGFWVFNAHSHYRSKRLQLLSKWGGEERKH